MHTQGPTTFEDALHGVEILDVNWLTEDWFNSREAPPSAASGLGVFALLAMLASGADGDTREDLLDATGLEIEQTTGVPAALIDAARSSPGSTSPSQCGPVLRSRSNPSGSRDSHRR